MTEKLETAITIDVDQIKRFESGRGVKFHSCNLSLFSERTVSRVLFGPARRFGVSELGVRRRCENRELVAFFRSKLLLAEISTDGQQSVTSIAATR